MSTTTDEPTRPTKNMTSNTRIARTAIAMKLIVSRILTLRSWDLDASLDAIHSPLYEACF